MDMDSLREDLERQMRSRSSTFDSGVPDDFPEWGHSLDELLKSGWEKSIERATSSWIFTKTWNTIFL